jgi:hypothetical protein
MTNTNHPPHIESVKHKTTTVTLVASEFEADVRVESKQLIADGIVTLTLREVRNHPLPRWQPGAHIDLVLEKAPTRQYSLCGDATDHHVWRVGILRDPNGRGSCGPEALLTAVEQRCAAWLPRSLHVERFSPKPLTDPALSGAFEVVLLRSELTLTVPPDRSILSLVEEAGIGVLSSCNEGTCETRVLAGQPDHRDSVLTKEERSS